jgi:single-stranded-DNA-specific exonuclease
VNALDHFAREGVTLFFTVDCGMTNHTEIHLARERGMECIVIDHHHVPEVLPEATAIVNPKLPDAGYPFTDLCGAGTSFKVAQALYQTLLPEAVPQLKWLLDIVALGTVADVMPLIGENRVLVNFGLIVLGKTRRVGLQEMYAVGRIPVDDSHQPDAWTIGFQIAPRINAASRMAHAMQAHELLMATDRVLARDLALELEANNVARQKVSTHITEQVRRVAQTQATSKLIFAVDESFAFGVVGLVAGRIAREFGKPVVVLQRGETTSQGSLRSIPGLSIIEALEECSDLLVKFGGHDGAAGLTVENAHLEAFQTRLDAVVERRLAGVTVEPELAIDMRLSPYLLTADLAREIKRFAPFGQGNPEPTFLIENMHVEEARLVGNGDKHLKLVLRPDATSHMRLDGIAFGLGERFPDLTRGTSLDIVFQLGENTWNGETKLQLKIADMRLSA